MLDTADVKVAEQWLTAFRRLVQVNHDIDVAFRGCQIPCDRAEQIGVGDAQHCKPGAVLEKAGNGISAAHAGTLPKLEESVIVKIADMCFAIQLAFLKLSNEPKVEFSVGELMQGARDQTNA